MARPHGASPRYIFHASPGISPAHRKADTNWPFDRSPSSFLCACVGNVAALIPPVCRRERKERSRESVCIWGIARRLASESSIHRVSSGVFTLSSARRRPSKRTCQNRTLAGIKHAACILGSPSVVSPLKRPTRFVNGWLISSTSTHLRLSSSTLDTTRCRVRAVSLCLCVWKASRRRSAPLASSTPSTVDALPLNPLCFFLSLASPPCFGLWGWGCCWIEYEDVVPLDT